MHVIYTIIKTKIFLNLNFSCIKWLLNCGRRDLCAKPVDVLHKYYRVCNDHFNAKMFSNPERTRLLPSAVPTVFCTSNIKKLYLFFCIYIFYVFKYQILLKKYRKTMLVRK